MRCSGCGTTGTGAYCVQCGHRLAPPDSEDQGGAFWAEDEPTNVSAPAEAAGPSTFPDYPWAGGGVGPQLAPPPGPPQRPGWPLAIGAALAVGLLVLGIGGGVVWFLTSEDEEPAAVSTETVSTDAPSTPTSTDTGDPAPTTSTVTTTTTTTTDAAPTISATDELNDLRDESLTLLYTDGRWAVSLSAKQDGTRDDRQVTSSGSHVFRLPDILELHEGYDSVYSSTTDVYLLKAEDLGSTTGPDGDRIWMTIVDPGGLSSRDDAERWCADEFPWLSGDDLDNACYPRQLRSP